MKKIGYWIILGFLLYGVSELSSFGALWFLKKFKDVKYVPVDVVGKKTRLIFEKLLAQEPEYIKFSVTLGWTVKENGKSSLFQANSSGLRSSREYKHKPPEGVLRIAAFGDSFTHCDNVANKDTWESFIENTDANIEVLNFGVSGFGLDQAYLRYLEAGRNYKAHIVFIGFMSENIHRNLNVYRPFYFSHTKFPLAKPRFKLDGENLTLLPNPMKGLEDYRMLLSHHEETLARIGRNDYYCQNGYKSSMYDWSPTVRLVKIVRNTVKKKLDPHRTIFNDRYNEESEAFKVTTRIFDEFYREAIKNKSIPIIVVFPDKFDISRYQKEKKKVYAPLLAYFDARGYRYLDLMEVFEQTEIEKLVVPAGEHYSPFANGMVANRILQYIKQQALLLPVSRGNKLLMRENGSKKVRK